MTCHQVHVAVSETAFVGQQLVPGVAAGALMFLGQTSRAGGVAVVAVVLCRVALAHYVGAKRCAQPEVAETDAKMPAEVDVVADHVVVVVEKCRDAVAVVLCSGRS